MSQYDKVVKMACKPKNAPPKSKYIDQLISATFSDDGSLADITRSLALRLREPNAVVVFKALLTLHMMIRTGNTENLLEHLSSSGDVLRLRNVGGSGQWEGYNPPSNMGMYAQYLDTRIRCFKDLKHDLVRAQNESNRRSDGMGANSKARRLRHLPVEKGLLREVKAIQRILDALVVCRFYEDDLGDENTIVAFRMLIKDVLVLFQAGNEGVCNILEHYFEMSKNDATTAFEIYKSFIKQTDRVVDYLGMAKKLHNVVNIPVPNLKHAPTSLVRALEEYLNDPNFENNRLEYKRSLGVVEGKSGGRDPSPSKAPSAAAKSSTASASAPAAASSTSNANNVSTPTAAAPPGASQKIQDFFDSIQAEQQPTMFGGPASNGFQNQGMQQMPMQFPFMAQQPQQQPFNPFRQSMMMPQQTGFMGAQMTGFPMGQQQPFMQPQMTGQMAFGGGGQAPPSSFLQPQQTAFLQPQPQHSAQGFLQPQQTGSNPFRQSIMVNTNTNPSGALSQPSSPFGQQRAMFANATFGSAGSAGAGGAGNQAQSPIQRPGSTPAFGALDTKPLVSQPTGSKNPFAPPPGSTPSVPKAPAGLSMNQLAANKMAALQTGGGINGFGAQGMGAGVNGKANTISSPGGGGGGMSDIASAFAFDGSKPTSPGAGGGGNSNNDFLSQFGSLSVNTQPTGSSTGASSGFTGFNTFSGTGTGTSGTAASSAPTSPGGFLQPQRTGFGGSSIKPFKPTSSFGSSLMEGLGSIPEPGMPGGSAFSQGGDGGTSPGGLGASGSGATGTPGPSAGFGSGIGGASGAGGVSAAGTNQFGQFGQLGQQSTGLGTNQFGQMSPTTPAVNPFRQNMFSSLGPASPGGAAFGAGAGGAFGGGGSFGQPQQQPPSQQGQATGQGIFGGMGTGMGGGAFGGMGGMGQQQQQQQQPFGNQNQGSLI